ncbi:Rgp1-domain-containing protein [Aulographum hederae CBS 113979]|uniref:Rgp1-domain-containing protein n=1 Tax=Aulographum hederae CBS 113979 TaxID=1176131 RepID=A0A6G1HDS9_9PEZI|nr:Rgp1-domain-containing protein [Aulographum hederae CBS 113979]
MMSHHHSHGHHHHPPPSNIRVSVQWKHATVFAGEDVECTITFRNVAPVPGAQTAQKRPLNNQLSSHAQNGNLASKAGTRASLSRHSSFGSQATVAEGGLRGGGAGVAGHRPALSLSTAGFANRRPSGPSTAGAGANGAVAGARGRSGRSLSIISMGAETPVGDGYSRGAKDARRPGGLGQGHRRAESYSVGPRKGSGGARNGSQDNQWLRSSRRNSPNPPSASTPLPQNEFAIPMRTGRRASNRSNGASTPRVASATRQSASALGESFKFPDTPPPDSSAVPSTADTASDEASVVPDSAVSPRAPVPHLRTHSPRPPEEPPGSGNLAVDSANPITRIISGSSLGGTPRSSMEIYSMSNNSTETLASEYVASQPANRLLPRPSHIRRTSSLRQQSHQHAMNQPETLMMGYAQIMGSFSLDGSLVNQAPFEEVKRKGVVGGQGGGGVVGVERSKRSSGLFGALGWGNIGESLGGLLNPGELSSIREMRGKANSKAIPLLSTPQSILFVDLQLKPGESRSYVYTFKLPKGLPPSHKGRAMKVEYHVAIGTQRPGQTGDGQQQVKSVEVPFRVLGSVNSRGEILHHDLMSPYILLRDTSTITSIALTPPADAAKALTPARSHTRNLSQKPDEDISTFLDYTDALLSKPSNSTSGLLSPTASTSHFSTSPAPSPTTPLPHIRRASSLGIEEPKSMKEAIDLAILRSNYLPPSLNGGTRDLERNTTAKERPSPIRFEIARSGLRVAVLSLPRPSFRLGETVNLTLAFDRADIKTYATTIALESVELVDPSLALRSRGSVERVTRKVHACVRENVVCARRVGVGLSVPVGGTPEFGTTGVRGEWRIRVEFVTERARVGAVRSPRGRGRRKSGDESAPDAEDEEEEVKESESDPTHPEEAEEEDLDFLDEIDEPIGLMETVDRDERHTLRAARERLEAESFEIVVPIRVYGSALPGAGGEADGVEDLIV